MNRWRSGKWQGEQVELIYMSEAGRLSQRSVRIIQSEPDRIRAYCYKVGGLRTFRTANILACRHAGGSNGY